MKKAIAILIHILVFGQVWAQSWNEAQKIVAADRDAGNYFGFSSEIDGSYAIVGAYLEGEDAAGLNTVPVAGAAYIYEKDINENWNQVQKIVPSDRSFVDFFGYSVAISGNYAVIGAFLEDEDAAGGNTLSNAGSAYVFERDGGGNWNEVQKIVASDRGVDDYFGASVSINGSYIIVGAYQEDEDTSGATTLSNSGSAYIFERDGGGNWNEVQKIVASDRGTTDLFGYDVSIGGNYAIVGAYQEDEDTSGAATLGNSGSAYIFERDGGGIWNEVQKIVASDREANDFFGFSVATNGNYVIVGAHREDQDTSGGSFLSDAGSVYIYERNGGSWMETQKAVANDRTTGDWYGYSVGINDDYAVVGAYREDHDTSGVNTLNDAGSAYILERQSNGSWVEAQKLVASDRGATDWFGTSVSVSENFVFIGANAEDEDTTGAATLTDAGSAYVFNTCLKSDSMFSRVACDSFVSPSGKYTWTLSGTFMDTLVNNSGCDSLLTINLTISNSSDTTFSVNSCGSYTSPSGNHIWTSDGTYMDTIPNATGCDSIITINLSVLTNSSSSISSTVCDTLFSPSGKYFWTVSGTYMDTVPNAIGCDSIITVNLTISNSTNSISASTCESYTSPSGNYTWTVSGTYLDTVPNAIGCDSIITVNLTILNSSNTIAPSACESYTSPSGNYTWTVSGTYMDTIPNASGCDSLLTVNLTILANSSSTIVANACASYASPSGNYTWTTSGTYMDTIPNSDGCDSILTINLSIQNSSSNLTISSCDSLTSPSGKYIWTASGTYMDTIPNTAGCDSLISVNLTILQSTSSNVSVNSCDSLISPSGKFVWKSSGIYMDTISNLAGCDSIISINLLVDTVDTSVTQIGDTLRANAMADAFGVTYQWLDCDDNFSIIDGETDQTFVPSVNGNYAVEITSNGCVDTSSCYSVVGIWINENEFGVELKVYPNPTQGELMITIESNYDELDIVVNNSLGQTVLIKKFVSNEPIRLLIDGSSGLYFVVVRDSKGRSAVVKVLKE